MTKQHPITPPPELVKEWIQEADGGHDPRWQEYEQDIANRAAQWGADQELEACCEWVDYNCPSVGDHDLEIALHAARRPKPPSLKQQALRAAHVELDPEGKNGSLIIRALKALPEDVIGLCVL